MTERQHDVVIVGGGPAGVSAALECNDIQLDVVVLEARPVLGGQVVEITHPVRNVATGWYADGRVLQTGVQTAAEGARRCCPAESPREQGRPGGRLARGGRSTSWRQRPAHRELAPAPQRLPIAADGAFSGDVTYHLESDPDHFTGRPVVVVGGGDSATLDALFLAPLASSVILAHRSEALTARHDIVARLRAEKRIEDLPGWEVESLRGGDRLEEVDVVHPATGDRRTLAAGGLVVKISRDPCTQPFRDQVDVDRRGFIVVDSELRASRPGVFAAGDVVSGAYWRVSNALGHGSLVSRTILRYLQDEMTSGS